MHLPHLPFESSRLKVMEHISDCMKAAWNIGDTVTAQSYHFFLNALELMTDREYEQCFDDEYFEANEPESEMEP